MSIYLVQQTAGGNFPPEMLMIMFGTLLLVFVVGGIVTAHNYFSKGKDDTHN